MLFFACPFQSNWQKLAGWTREQKTEACLKETPYHKIANHG